MQSADKWTESQKVRVRILLERYPKLEEAYSITHSLRMIYNYRNATRESGLESLGNWYNKVTDFNDDAFNTVSATIYEKQEEIVNYFVYRSTNASAESLNSKIKNFRAQLHGVVDVEFFLYRLNVKLGVSFSSLFPIYLSKIALLYYTCTSIEWIGCKYEKQRQWFFHDIYCAR